MRIYRDRLLDNIIIMLLNRVMKSWFYSFSDYMNVYFTDRSIIYRGVWGMRDGVRGMERLLLLYEFDL